MQDGYRKVAVFGSALSIASTPFIYVGVYPQQAGLAFCLGIIYMLLAWFLKSPTDPPVSFGYWLVAGNPPEYSEMTPKQLYFHIKWLEFSYREKTHFARSLEKLLGFTHFEKYTTETIEQSFSDAVRELQNRDHKLAAQVEVEFDVEVVS